jgi:hypothetical protein
VEKKLATLKTECTNLDNKSTNTYIARTERVEHARQQFNDQKNTLIASMKTGSVGGLHPEKQIRMVWLELTSLQEMFVQVFLTREQILHDLHEERVRLYNALKSAEGVVLKIDAKNDRGEQLRLGLEDAALDFERRTKCADPNTFAPRYDRTPFLSPDAAKRTVGRRASLSHRSHRNSMKSRSKSKGKSKKAQSLSRPKGSKGSKGSKSKSASKNKSVRKSKSKSKSKPKIVAPLPRASLAPVDLTPADLDNLAEPALPPPPPVLTAGKRKKKAKTKAKKKVGKKKK